MNVEDLKYPKEFIWQMNMWSIKDSKPIIKYLDEVFVDYKKYYGTIKEKEFKMKILNDFFDVYEYDCKNSIMPIAEEYNVKHNNSMKILYNDITLILSNIFIDMHREIALRKLPFPVYHLPNNVIDYNLQYYEALNTYFLNLLGVKNSQVIDMDSLIYCRMNEEKSKLKKMNNPPCIFTTYCMLPLIEYILIEKLNTLMIRDCLNKIIIKLNNQELNIPDETFIFLNKFNFDPNIVEEYSYTNMELEKLYEIFVGLNIIEDNESNIEIITKAKWNSSGKRRSGVTLGDIIKNKYLIENTEEIYYKFIYTLFGVDKINLRNVILHGKGASFDYFSIGYTAILVQIFWDIMNNTIFTEECLKKVKKENITNLHYKRFKRNTCITEKGPFIFPIR